jgi:hypothetical protein
MSAGSIAGGRGGRGVPVREAADMVAVSRAWTHELIAKGVLRAKEL